MRLVISSSLVLAFLMFTLPAFATDVSDNFNVSDGLAGWTVYDPPFAENGTILFDNDAEALVTHTGTSVGGSDNWACIQVVNIPLFSRWGVQLRSNNTDGESYTLHMRTQNQDTVDWEHFNGSVFSIIKTGVDTSDNSFTVGNWFCGTVEGQGANTLVMGYEFTSAPDPYENQAQWEGLGSFDRIYEIAADCLSLCVAAGTYVGVYGLDANGGGSSDFDNFSGGCIDCDPAAGISLTGVNKK